jgi:hypothetical protein
MKKLLDNDWFWFGINTCTVILSSIKGFWLGVILGSICMVYWLLRIRLKDVT